jgi:uncharacterized membrane protein YeaQ/YmgE (transglycosylase-associated protein family)
MAVVTVLLWLAIGAVAGWIASRFARIGSFGLVGDIAAGIAGAFIGTWLLPRIGILMGDGIFGTIGAAVIGTAFFLLLQRMIYRLF